MLEQGFEVELTLAGILLSLRTSDKFFGTTALWWSRMVDISSYHLNGNFPLPVEELLSLTFLYSSVRLLIRSWICLMLRIVGTSSCLHLKLYCFLTRSQVDTFLEWRNFFAHLAQTSKRSFVSSSDQRLRGLAARFNLLDAVFEGDTDVELLTYA